MDRLEEIKARRAAISPAPWKRGDEWTSNLVSDAEGEIVVYDEGRPGEDDAEFITHAPADIDWLVEQADLAKELGDLLPQKQLEVDRLRGLLARLEWAGVGWNESSPAACPACHLYQGEDAEHDRDRGCWLAAELPAEPARPER